MSSRRAFLGTTAAAGLAALNTGANRSPASPYRAISEQTQTPALPPSIAALQSMQGRMVPITNAERADRLERARRLMLQHGFDAIILMGGTSLKYFTAIEWGVSERTLALVLPIQGAAFVVCPAFEHDRALEQIAAGPLGKGTRVLTWEEHEDPYALIAKGLRDAGYAAGFVGFEESTRYVFVEGISRALPSAHFTSATPVTAGCRTIKSPAEIALMRLASDVTLRAYAAAYHALRDGMTQNDFAALVRLAHERLGFRGGAGVQVGPYSALPHGSATPQTIREGTILLIDGGCTVGGYQSDLSRTFVLGKPTDRMKQVFEIEVKAQEAALRAARPGVECQAVDAAARKVITDAGFGPDYRFFTHRVGHGIGMDEHEWPYLVKGNTLPLAAGMTFSDEPGIYIPGEFGVRLEDDMVITESGAELLTPPSRSIEEPFGAS